MTSLTRCESIEFMTIVTLSRLKPNVTHKMIPDGHDTFTEKQQNISTYVHNWYGKAALGMLFTNQHNINKYEV